LVPLRHDDVRFQNAQLAPDELSAVVEQHRRCLPVLRIVLATLGAVDVSEILTDPRDCQTGYELAEQHERKFMRQIPMLVLVELLDVPRHLASANSGQRAERASVFRVGVNDVHRGFHLCLLRGPG